MKSFLTCLAVLASFFLLAAPATAGVPAQVETRTARIIRTPRVVYQRVVVPQVEYRVEAIQVAARVTLRERLKARRASRSASKLQMRQTRVMTLGVESIE